jgi:hypothetical protein
MVLLEAIVLMVPAEQIAAEIRAELRSILRQRQDLRRPLDWFGLVESRVEGEPRYYVLFDQNPRLVVKGLRLGGLGKLRVPDERIIDRVFEFAKSVWQFKDRLKLWVKLQGAGPDIEAAAASSQNLLICADLANWKKHGENKNRSGLDPRIDFVTFDTSRNEAVELYADGGSKHQELLVAKDIPIPYRVDVHGKGGVQLGDASDLIWCAFQDWLPIITSTGVLDGDNRESEYLRQQLFSLEQACA